MWITMEKLVLIIIFLVMCCEIDFVFSHKHHPRFPKPEEYDDLSIKKVACTSDHDKRRNEIIKESKCGVPRDVFIYLEPSVAHEQISPGAVWVKRCVGLCDYDYEDSKCVALETRIRHIPVRIYNARTHKEVCATYPVEEHTRCGCCGLSPEGCASPRVYNPRKCTCKCPNLEERRKCQRSLNMKWNRFKCKCMEKRKRNKT